jgi:hypothetical protein
MYVDKFISLMKKVLRKSPRRQQLFKNATNLPLPPNPIIIRWNSWLSTASYYAKNYSLICNFIKNLENSSKAIKNVQTLISLNDLSDSLIEISEFTFLTDSITKLESQGLRLKEQLEILYDVKSKLKEKPLEKLENSLRKNPDFLKFTNPNNDHDFKMQIKYAPLVSVDVERSFSTYKSILTDRRHNLTEENIEHFNIINYNKFLFDI